MIICMCRCVRKMKLVIIITFLAVLAVGLSLYFSDDSVIVKINTMKIIGVGFAFITISALVRYAIGKYLNGVSKKPDDPT